MDINNTLSKYIAQLNINEKMMQGFLNAVNNGNNYVNQILTAESLYLDDEWILTITKYLHSIEQICKNPRRFIIDQKEVVPVEKARKIDSESIRHLASHTMNIRGSNEEGEIIPSRILTTYMAEDLAIYENRFVVTLINRLVTFIEQRYNYVEQNVNSKDVIKLKFTDDCKFGKADFAFDLGITVRTDSKNIVMLKRNSDLLNQIEVLRKRINILRMTDFYITVNKAKPVVLPISKTNLIINDKDYSNCYKLFLFISGYAQLGYSVEVAEKQLSVDTDFFDDLTMLAMLSFLTLLKNQVAKTEDYEKKEYSDKTVKRYKLNKRIKAPDINLMGEKDTDFEINEFFFDKVRKLLSGWQENSVTENGSTDINKLRKNFPSVFIKFNQLADAIYNEYLKQDNQTDEAIVLTTAIEKKKQQYDRQKDYTDRLRLLNLQKEKELSLALKKEAKELIKLDKLKREVEKSDAKKETKKQKSIKKADKKAETTNDLGVKTKTIKVEALSYADLLKSREEQKRKERIALLNEKRAEFLRKKAMQKQAALQSIDTKADDIITVQKNNEI